MSFSELIILMFIALILFGPEDLPDVARALGKIIYEIRKVAAEMTKEFQDALNSPSEVLQKAFEETVKPSSVASEKPSQKQPEGERTEHALLTYEDESTPSKMTTEVQEKLDPLAELPPDMVSYEKKGTSR